jgi:3-phenylpropionate/cinnamic acid dioxygenase small subunit
MTATVTAPAGFDPTATRHRLDDDIRAFFAYEAMLLDDASRLWDWFALLAEDIAYLVPIRLARERRSSQPPFPHGSYHMKEDYFTLRARVQRLETEHAWAEEPPSRLRRVVSAPLTTDTDRNDEFRVRTSFLLYRGRGGIDGDLLAGTRDDVLRVREHHLLLTRRTGDLDHTVLPTANLGIFL